MICLKTRKALQSCGRAVDKITGTIKCTAVRRHPPWLVHFLVEYEYLDHITSIQPTTSPLLGLGYPANERRALGLVHHAGNLCQVEHLDNRYKNTVKTQILRENIKLSSYQESIYLLDR